MTLIFHPSCITYDNSISKTWEQYRLKRKKNQNVKDFRLAIWMPANPHTPIVDKYVKNHGDTLEIGELGDLKIFTKL